MSTVSVHKQIICCPKAAVLRTPAGVPPIYLDSLSRLVRRISSRAPRYPATRCDGQWRSGLNTSVLPRARLEYHVQPQQTGGDYKNTCLKIMVDALTSGSTFFDQSACQIKSGSGYKSRYRDRRCDAYQWNEFTEQDTGHQKCENDCGKRNGTGLPANYDRSAHFPFLGLKHRSGDSRTKFFKQDVHLQKCI